MTIMDHEQNTELMLRAKIDQMSHTEMARKHRFAPVGDPMFQGRVGEYFAEHFKELGGMTTAISKQIGW